MSWRATILTLFPGMFPGPLGQSLAGRAMESGIWTLEAQDIRDFAPGRHRNVDDTPFGGGAGMVMRPDVVDAAIADGRRWPPAALRDPARAAHWHRATHNAWPRGPALIVLCGRYEGVDQRVIDARAARRNQRRRLCALRRRACRHGGA